MSLILSGTNGLSDVDGTAATPAIRGTDANTGIFFPAADQLAASVNGVEGLRLTSTGLGIGTSTIGSTGISLTSSYNVGWVQSAGESVPNIFRQTSSAATVLANGYRYTSTANGFASSFSSSFAKTAIALNSGVIAFYTDTAAAVAAGTDVTPSERARIDASGNLLVGTTSRVNPASKTAISVSSASAIAIETNVTSAVDYYPAIFYRNGTTAGYITTSGNTVVYAVSSDYRLKENVQPMTGALAKVAALKPCTYKWKADGSDGEGFIAHELAEVVPQCVSGEKDAVDAKGRPFYQGIDTSFLVATLTAAIQEQQAMIAQLQADIASLKGTA